MTFGQALDGAIVRLTAEFTEKMRDGFSFQEALRFFFSCTGELADLGKQYADTPNNEKRALILGALRKIYKRTNPDLPLVPEPFETMLEDMLMRYVMPAAYDWVADRI